MPPSDLALQLRPTTEAEIWRAIDEEFHAERSEQVPARARMIQVLELIDQGRWLTVSPQGRSVSVWLEGIPEIKLFAGFLFSYRYVTIVERSKDGRLVYFSLSREGQRKLDEGLEWWKSLSFLEKALVRVRG